MNSYYSSVKKLISLFAFVILMLVELRMFYDFSYPFRVLWSQGKLTELLLSLILFFWSMLGAFLIFFSGRSIFRKITLPIFIFFMLFNIGSFKVSKEPIDFQQAVLIVGYFQWWLGEVIENIGLAVLPLLIIYFPTVLFVERLPDITKFGLPKKVYLIPVSAILFCSIGLHYSGGFVDRYPSFFRIPSMLVFASESRVYNGERSAVSYSGFLDAQVEKIILIVDESIRADILGVNSYEKNTTPYLYSIDKEFVNFGLAASSSNCSHYSNLLLRTGLRKQEIPDYNQMTLKQSSIWQLTRKAGFHNVYLDA